MIFQGFGDEFRVQSNLDCVGLRVFQRRLFGLVVGLGCVGGWSSGRGDRLPGAVHRGRRISRFVRSYIRDTRLVVVRWFKLITDDDPAMRRRPSHLCQVP